MQKRYYQWRNFFIMVIMIMQTTGAQHQYSKFAAPVYDSNGDNIAGFKL